MVEEKIDVALISDPYRADARSTSWLTSAGSSRAAIYIVSNGVTIANLIRDPEFISARLNGVQVYSCYASPNQPLVDLDDLLQRLGDSIRSIQRGVPILVAGDLNARSVAWGDRIENQRGHELSSLVESQPRHPERGHDPHLRQRRRINC